MIPKAAIAKAIEGGWIYRQGLSFYRWELCSMGHPWIKAWFDPDQGDQWQEIAIEEIALDPAFWKALGEALVWESYETWTGLKFWDFKAEEFIHLILTGANTEAFWSELLK